MPDDDEAAAAVLEADADDEIPADDEVTTDEEADDVEDAAPLEEDAVAEVAAADDAPPVEEDADVDAAPVEPAEPPVLHAASIAATAMAHGRGDMIRGLPVGGTNPRLTRTEPQEATTSAPDLPP